VTSDGPRLGYEPAAPRSWMKRIIVIGRRIRAIKELYVCFMTSIVFLIFYVLNPAFLGVGNLNAILTSIGDVGIMTVGVTFLMISGEFDLSVGSVFALIPMIFFTLFFSVGILPAILLSLLVACGIGALNGFLTVRMGIPSFIVTLAGLMAYRGAVLLISQGFVFTITREFFTLRTILVDNPILGLNALFFLWMGIVAIWTVVLERTGWGNQTMASGADPTIAREMGVNVSRIKFFNFVVCSFLTGFAGILQFLRIATVQPSTGDGYELQAIAAAVIGGTSLFGGMGSIIGSAVGTLFTLSIDTGLILIGVGGYGFRIFIGVVIVAAVFVYRQLYKIR
jgi:simple sugar transport system permease protein